MSVKVSSLVWESNIGPANKRMVLLALADNANDRGYCMPGTAYLTGKTFIPRSTLFRIMKELEEEGIMQRRERRRANGSRRSNAYRINLELLAARKRLVSVDETNELESLFEDDEPQVEHMVSERDDAGNEETSRSDAWSRSGTGVVPERDGCKVPERDPLNHHSDRHSDQETSSSTAPPPREDVEQLCRELRDRMIANGCKPPSITKAWRTAARLLLDKDGRDLDKAMSVLDWTMKDPFWIANVQSMDTFRKQYDKLRLKAVYAWQQERRAATPPAARPSTADARLMQQLADRGRMFNPDGSFRSDVALDAHPTQPAAQPYALASASPHGAHR